MFIIVMKNEDVYTVAVNTNQGTLADTIISCTQPVVIYATIVGYMSFWGDAIEIHPRNIQLFRELSAIAQNYIINVGL